MQAAAAPRRPSRTPHDQRRGVPCARAPRGCAARPRTRDRRRQVPTRRWPARSARERMAQRAVPCAPSCARELDPSWLPSPSQEPPAPYPQCTAFCRTRQARLGLRRGELIALRKEDLDLVAGTLTVARSRDADTTKGGRTVTLPTPEPLRPYLRDRRSLVTLRVALPEGGRGTAEPRPGSYSCPASGARPRRHRRRVRASVPQAPLRPCRARVRQRAAPVPQGWSCALAATSAPTALVPFAAPHVRDAAREGPRASEGRSTDSQTRGRRDDARHLHPRRPGRHARSTFADVCCQFTANGSIPKVEAPDRSRLTEKDRGLRLVGATGFEPATTCTPTGPGSRATVISSLQPFGILRSSECPSRPRVARVHHV